MELRKFLRELGIVIVIDIPCVPLETFLSIRKRQFVEVIFDFVRLGNAFS